jgi:hypothetical protein
LSWASSGGSLLLTGLFFAGTIWLASSYAGTIESLRDILIIVLALEFCLFGIVLIMLLIMVMRLITMLEFEIKPILEKTNETVGTIRGTTTFVSQNVVKPMTKASAFMSGPQCRSGVPFSVIPNVTYRIEMAFM